MTTATTKVFLSYASDDNEIATAIEDALNQLAKQIFFNLEIIRDIHTFQQGQQLKKQVINYLEVTDILFIIYTETLKSSHSYTGFEIGAFSVYIKQDIAKQGRSDRRIVSVYLDDPPVTEVDILGIKLNTAALGLGSDCAKSIDPSDGFGKFFKSLSDKGVTELFMSQNGPDINADQASNLAILKNEKRSFVDKTIIPAICEFAVYGVFPSYREQRY